MLKQFTCIFNFLNILFQYKAKTKLMPSKLASQRGVQLRRSVSQHGVRLCAVLVNAKADSTQCQLQCSVRLHAVLFSSCRVTYFKNAKTNLFAKPFKTIYQGTMWVRFMKKIQKKSRDTATSSLFVIEDVLLQKNQF